jgi:hypothetical protein
MSTIEVQRPLNYFRIAWQSAIAAAFCLGLPAGLVLWLILFQQVYPSTIIKQLVTLLQRNGLSSIFILALCSLLWSYLLARISDYRPWWKIGLATVTGILVGWFSPLSNLDGWFGDGLPVHTLYTVAMCGIIGSATLCVGLAYGLLLRSIRAALTLGLTTGAASILGLLLTVELFDQFGIRVGTGNFAMSKVTVTSLLASAVLGGMVLGVEFSRFVRAGNYQRSAFS